MPGNAFLPFKVFYTKVSDTLNALRERARKSGKLDQFVQKLLEVHKHLEEEPLSFGDIERMRGNVQILRRLMWPFNVGFAVHTVLR